MPEESPRKTEPLAITRSGRYARLLNACRRLVRVLRDPRARSEWRTRREHKGLHFQGDTFTLPNRYAALFEHCQGALGNVSTPRILSFGCATGEEVSTLLEYLPRAEVFGVDINRWCLQQCELRHAQPQAHFLLRGSAEFAALVEVDAIFCMAVLQRTENRFSEENVIREGFRFEQFEREIAVLDGKLKAGGLLYLDHCDFRFEDTGVASRYDVVQSEASQRIRERHLYGRDNHLVSLRYRSNRIFAKREAA